MSESEFQDEDEKLFETMQAFCHDRAESIWFVADILILITGMAANVPWLWLFLRDRKSLSASKVLGVNLIIMNLIYLSIIPISIITTSTKENDNTTQAAFSSFRSETRSHTNSPLESGWKSLDMLSQIGCPLLLTCMCIERYLAVCRPVMYLRMRKREYRMMVSAVVWIITGVFCAASAVVTNRIQMMLSIVFIMSGLFVVMLACLGGVVWSLWQKSPAHSSFPRQTHSESPLKRQAVINVLVVVGSAVAIYLPVLAMVPVVFCMSFEHSCPPMDDDLMCDVFELVVLFPSFGVLIGPLFFLSKAKQMICLKGTGKTSNTQ